MYAIGKFLHAIHLQLSINGTSRSLNSFFRILILFSQVKIAPVRATREGRAQSNKSIPLATLQRDYRDLLLPLDIMVFFRAN